MVKENTPLKFSGNRNLKDIKKDVISSGGEWHDQDYQDGSDHITFTYQGRQIIYNTFNGRFFTQFGEERVTERSVEMEREQWYIDLLNLLYKPLAAA